MFSIISNRLSSRQKAQPGFKYLRVTITEHMTGNTALIPEYPCRHGHSPSIEELLSFLLDKSMLYVDALDSPMPAHIFFIRQFQLQEIEQGQVVLEQTRDCFKALCSLFKGTQVGVPELRRALKQTISH